MSLDFNHNSSLVLSDSDLSISSFCSRSQSQPESSTELPSDNKNNDFLTSTPNEINDWLRKMDDNDSLQKNDSNLINFSFEQNAELNQSNQLNNVLCSIQSNISNIDNKKSNKLSNFEMINFSNNSEITPAQRPFKKRKIDEINEQNSISFDSIETMISSKRNLNQFDYD